MSGTSHLRPGYQKLLEDMRHRLFDVVVAEALDRLSRDQEHVALSLAVGMALSGPPGGSTEARASPASTDMGQSGTVPADAPHSQVDAALRTHPVTVFRASDLLGWLQQHGGRADTSMRRLGDALGCSSSRAHNEVRRLVNTGKITAASTPRGTLLELAPAARPN